jgi:hypothetical protein
VQAAGVSGGFTPALFRAFYLLGGVLGVIYLALGTLFLLAPGRLARVAAAIVVGLTVALSVDAAFVGVDPGRLHDSAGILGEALTGAGDIPLRAAAIALNIVGSLILIGGSAWSAWRLARDRAGVDRVVCNVLLTVGALVIAAGLSAAKLRGSTSDSLATLGSYEAIGIAAMFAGFLALGRLGRPAQRGATLSRARGSRISS